MECEIVYNEVLENELKNLQSNSNRFVVGRKLHSKKYIALYEYVMYCTQMFKNISLTTRIFHTLHHNTKQLTCLTCGKELTDINVKNPNAKTFRDAFIRFCSPSCGQLHEDTKEKLKKTNVLKHGYEYIFKSKTFKENSKQIMFERYGCEYAQQNKEIKQKSYTTMLKKHGKKYPSQVKSIQQKIKISSRASQYKKFQTNKYVIPCFTKDEYIQFGDSIEWKWKCLECGNEFKAFRNEIWFKEGQVKSYARCEKCYPYNLGISKQEREIAEFLSTYTNVKFNSPENWSIIKPLQLDIYIPEKKLAIEFDGLYWHSYNESNKNKNYHLNKTELCEKQGIHLVHIFENEWHTKQEIVKSRLKNLLGIYDKTIFARKCEIKVVDSKTSKEFQNTNHIQGSINQNISLGLFYKNELVSLMTFGKPRFSKKYEWELLRFCNKLGYHIPGAAGKLLKHFEETWMPKSLVSYADRRWTTINNNVYQSIGFQLVNKSKPNYWYWKNVEQLLSRINFQKHKLKNKLQIYDESLSEIKNMYNNGYKAIYDCGNLVYLKLY